MTPAERLHALAERFVGVEPEDREYLPFQEIEQELRALADVVEGKVPATSVKVLVDALESALCALRHAECHCWPDEPCGVCNAQEKAETALALFQEKAPAPAQVVVLEGRVREVTGDHGEFDGWQLDSSEVNEALGAHDGHMVRITIERVKKEGL